MCNLIEKTNAKWHVRFDVTRVRIQPKIEPSELRIESTTVRSVPKQQILSLADSSLYFSDLFIL